MEEDGEIEISKSFELSSVHSWPLLDVLNKETCKDGNNIRMVPAAPATDDTRLLLSAVDSGPARPALLYDGWVAGIPDECLKEFEDFAKAKSFMPATPPQIKSASSGARDGRLSCPSSKGQGHQGS